MRSLAVLALLVASTAYAQPGAQPPPPPMSPYVVPPPQQYQPGYVAITREEHELLLRGEISDGEHVAGGVASLFLGFGVGQAIQGRWSDTGYIFTIGEAASAAVMIAGAFRTFDDCTSELGTERDCDHSDGPPMIVLGLVGLGVFRIWEIIDAFGGPSEHNRRVRELKYRVGVPVRVGQRVQPYLIRTRDSGATAGLTIHF